MFFGTHWLDKAGAGNDPGAVTDSDFISGTVETPLAPQEPLSAATDYLPGGQWHLRVQDTENNGQVGTLNSFALTATSYICRPVLEVSVDEADLARITEPVPAILSVNNSGGATTAPVYLTATLPITASFLDASGPGWACGGVAAGAAGGTLVCSRADMAAGEASTVTVRFDAPAAPEYMGNVVARAASLGANSTGFVTSRINAGAHAANGNAWDVVDKRLFPNGGDRGHDTGSVDDGGQDAFDDWGALRLRVFSGGSLLASTPALEHFGLVYAPGQYWHTTTPVVVTGSIQVARSLYAPPSADWLRYVDTFTNTSGASRTVWVSWGGDLGSDSETLVAGSSSGDATLTSADTWAVSIELSDPLGDPPLGYALRSPADTTYQGPGDFDAAVFTSTWGLANEFLGHVYKLELGPGASASLGYFVYKGLNESGPGPNDCEFYDDCLSPTPGTQLPLAQARITALALQPNFCDLTAGEFAKIANWPDKSACGATLYLPIVVR